MSKGQRLVIDDAILKKNKLSLNELLMLLCVYGKIVPETAISSLLKQGLVCEDKYAQLGKIPFYISSKGKRIIENMVNDLTEEGITDDVIIVLAKELQELFPTGKKPGLTYYWRGNTMEIVKKLKGFYKRYGTSYSKEQIIEATKAYITSFNGNTTYMQLLKYFIWKVKDNGEEVSELAAYIENLDSGETPNNDDWTTKLI